LTNKGAVLTSIELAVLTIDSARRIQRQGSRSARWIAADALRELIGAAVQKRLQTLRSSAHLINTAVNHDAKGFS
jgi:hypothetical protein